MEEHGALTEALQVFGCDCSIFLAALLSKLVGDAEDKLCAYILPNAR